MTITDVAREAASSESANRVVPGRGVALCLSGRGYTAMLCQAGCLRRLNELGWLPRIACVSSVSGAAIAAAMLGVKWTALAFDDDGVAKNFVEQVIDPLRALASESVEDWSVIGAAFSSWSPGEIVANALDEYLFAGATLQNLPEEHDGGPAFVFTASNVDAGSLMSFSKPRVWDSRGGSIARSNLRLALAVAAATSSPPWLSTALMMGGSDIVARTAGSEKNGSPSQDVVLTDGGVLDSLGLEVIWDSYRDFLVSDAGYGPPRNREAIADSISEAARIVDLLLERLRSARRRTLIDRLVSGGERAERAGTYWDMRAESPEWPMPAALTAAPALRAIDKAEQEALINWGYTICDAAMSRSSADRQLHSVEHV